MSLFEISKLIPQLLRKFEFELDDADAELEVASYWLAWLEGLVCRVRPRKL